MPAETPNSGSLPRGDRVEDLRRSLRATGWATAENSRRHPIARGAPPAAQHRAAAPFGCNRNPASIV